MNVHMEKQTSLENKKQKRCSTAIIRNESMAINCNMNLSRQKNLINDELECYDD